MTSGAWATSYAIGGDVEPTSVAAGINYDANGVQLGLYRWLNFDTLYGIFGGYADQNVDTILGDKAAMVDSGQLGLFLRRGDMDRYWLLAASVAYDSYHMERALTIGAGTAFAANGDFSGLQTSAYIERAVSMCVRGFLLQPSCALQYTWLQQNEFAETGYAYTNVSPLTFDEANTSSLRSIIGARISRERRMHSGLIVCAPELRANWMHEYLDDTTTVAIANQSFPGTSTGVSLGRDWAVLGVGFTVGFGDTFSLFADYDLQLNDRASLQVGSFGAQCEW